MSDAREWLTDAATGVIDIEASVVAMHDALLAVLDLHVSAIYAGGVEACSACDRITWPCPTVRAIDKALGVTDE